MDKAEEQGKLYLIPSLLGDVEPLEVLPLSVKKTIDLLDYYIVENEKTARAFIKRVLPSKHQPDLQLYVLNKFTEAAEWPAFLEPCLRGESVGLISEAGAPGIADPGAEMVSLAHEKNIRVVPLTGPSSILLAMMASGMNGQNFAFTGYLPIDKADRIKRIKSLESQSRKQGQTQIFMETPYRNEKLFQDLIKHCQTTSRLCVAREISTKDEYIRTLPIGAWKKEKPDLEKRPTIFILDAQT